MHITASCKLGVVTIAIECSAETWIAGMCVSVCECVCASGCVGKRWGCVCVCVCVSVCVCVQRVDVDCGWMCV